MDLILICALAMAIGIMVGLLPALPIFTAPLIMLSMTQFVSAESIVMIWILAIVGATFFSSVAVITTKVPGEENTLIYIRDLDGMTAAQRLDLIRSTAMGSMIAGFIGVACIYVIIRLLSGADVNLFALSWVQALIYTSLLVSVIWITRRHWIVSMILILLGLMIGTKNNFAVPDWWIQVQSLLVDKTIFMMAVTLFVIPALIQSHKTHTTSLPQQPSSYSKFPWWLSIKSAVAGFVAGLVPGPGTYTGSFVAYNMAKAPRDRIIAAETANNSGGIASTVPLMLTAIPTNQNSLLVLAALESTQTDITRIMFEAGSWGMLLLDQVLLAVVISSILFYFLSTHFLAFYAGIIRFFNHGHRWLMFLIILLLCILDIHTNSVSVVGYTFLFVIFAATGLLLHRYDINPLPLIFAVIIGDRVVWSLIHFSKIYL